MEPLPTTATEKDTRTGIAYRKDMNEWMMDEIVQERTNAGLVTTGRTEKLS
jgi:hypothetical protein